MALFITQTLDLSSFLNNCLISQLPTTNQTFYSVFSNFQIILLRRKCLKKIFVSFLTFSFVQKLFNPLWCNNKIMWNFITYITKIIYIWAVGNFWACQPLGCPTFALTVFFSLNHNRSFFMFYCLYLIYYFLNKRNKKNLNLKSAQKLPLVPKNYPFAQKLGEGSWPSSTLVSYAYVWWKYFNSLHWYNPF